MPESVKTELEKLNYEVIYAAWSRISKGIDFFVDGRARDGDVDEMKKALDAFIKGTEKAIELIEKSRQPLPMTAKEVEATTHQEACSIWRTFCLKVLHKNSPSL